MLRKMDDAGFGNRIERRGVEGHPFIFRFIVAFVDPLIWTNNAHIRTQIDDAAFSLPNHNGTDYFASEHYPRQIYSQARLPNGRRSGLERRKKPLGIDIATIFRQGGVID